MGATFCSRCGQPGVAGAAFCASCGAPVAGIPLAPGAPRAAPSAWQPVAPPYPQYGFPRATPTAPPSPATDLSALSSVTVAAILGLIGTVLGLVELFATSTTAFVGATTVGSGTSFSVNPAGLYLTAALAGVGLVFSLVELLLYRQAFRTLAPTDARFGTPATLVLMAAISLIIIVVLAFSLIALLYQSVVCAGTGNPLTTACLNVGEFLGLGILLLVVGIIALVGYIGLLIGIWRLGTRYNQSLFKVGAILLVIPVLNVIGIILILVAANSARHAVTGIGPMAGFT